MVKRVASGVLWFFAVTWGWNWVALMSGLPSFFGLVLGATVGAFVWADPLHRFWPVGQDAPARQTVPPALVPGAAQGRI